MKIWKNTNTLNEFDDGLTYTEFPSEANLMLMGSKTVDLELFPNLNGIFRVGIGNDNVPERKALLKNIIVRYPSEKTKNIIFDETANFTCGLIFRMLYNNVGTINPWYKSPRRQLSNKILLVIGTGKIGNRVANLMKSFIKITTFDILTNKDSELKPLLKQADCVTIHIPKNIENISFLNKTKLSWMKNGAILINTARGNVVDEIALYKELKNYRLKAAFDVYWEEPYKGKLSEFFPDLFYMTPHVASTCSEFLKGCRDDLDKFIKELSN